MKKFLAFLLALVLISSSQAFAYSITKSLEERVNDAATGDSYRRVTGYLTLDSSHPAEGERFAPSEFGMASFTSVTIGAGGPAAWPAAAVGATVDNVRRFGFDYTTNKVYVISISTIWGAAAAGASALEVSGPITYDLDYLTKVPFQAVGPIS